MSGVSTEIAAGLHALAQANPIAAGVAVVALALVLAIVVFGRSKAVFADVAQDSRRDQFQQQLLTEMQSMRGREAALEAQNARLLEQYAEMRVQMELLREQVRRLIDMLRAVQEGRVSPNAITLPEAQA